MNAAEARARATQWASETDRMYRARAERALEFAADHGGRAVELVLVDGVQPSRVVRDYLTELGYRVMEPTASGCWCRVEW